MKFQEADRRYVDLKQQYDSGSLSAEEFEAQLEEIMVQDDEDRWWSKHPETGEWHYYDGSTWVQDTPSKTGVVVEPPPVQESTPVQEQPPVQPQLVQERPGLWIGSGIVIAVVGGLVAFEWLGYFGLVLPALGFFCGYKAVKKGSKIGGLSAVAISTLCLFFAFFSVALGTGADPGGKSSPESANTTLTDQPSTSQADATTGKESSKGTSSTTSETSAAPTDQPANTTSTVQPPNGQADANAERENSKGASSTSSSNSAAPADQLRAAVDDYYKAVDRQDWDYTYDRLDSQTKLRFTRTEWKQKNQYFADNYPLQLSSPKIVGDAKSPPVLVTLTQTFKDGVTKSRDTYFVYEDGSWKHRFSPDELKLFMAGTSFDAFKKAQ